jgi:hypothetical protein
MLKGLGTVQAVSFSADPAHGLRIDGRGNLHTPMTCLLDGTICLVPGPEHRIFCLFGS